jgi:hypothetical protein
MMGRIIRVCLYIEPEVYNVAFLHHVLFALEADEPFFLRGVV